MLVCDIDCIRIKKVLDFKVSAWVIISAKTFQLMKNTNAWLSSLSNLGNWECFRPDSVWQIYN